MLLLPEIDIRNGRCVRLAQGRDEARTLYGEPVERARDWIAQGAQALHLVDLDGAMDAAQPASAGTTERLDPFARICGLGVPVQWGGGIRTREDIERRFACGAARVVLGTVALTDPALVREACRAYPERIVCGIDARDGKVATHGWLQSTDTDAFSLAQAMRDIGVTWIVYTDIARDGMLTGPNVAQSERLSRLEGVRVIGSGGVGALEHIVALRDAGCYGAIVGKALYEGRFTLAQALAAVRDDPPDQP